MWEIVYTKQAQKDAKKNENIVFIYNSYIAVISE